MHMVPPAVVGAFVWLVGLCVGSFLNVVVYRLPAGLSVRRPARSFCPRCQTSIAWYDNVPIVSWLVLRARCRHCRAPISVRYPLIEALTGLVFVQTYHLLVVDGARAGLHDLVWPTDLPVLGAWFVLVAALIACAAMDLVSYAVDTRVTDAAMYAGIVLAAAWPRETFYLERAATPAGAAALAAFAVSGVMLWLTVWRAGPHAGTELDTGHPTPGRVLGTETWDDAPSGQPRDAAPLAGRLGVMVFLALAVWLVVVPGAKTGPAVTTAGGPATVGIRWHVDLAVPGCILALFVATVLVGGQRRPADEELATAIEEEGPHARRAALRELLWLSPAAVAAVVTYLAVDQFPALQRGWTHAVAWPESSSLAPLGGAAFAIHGAMVGAVAGWMLRIVFTLAIGREAFGLGDVYILAAAGAVGGWDIALLGLLLAVGLAMAGWLAGLLLKATVMIPFGPWLAIGFLAALWLNRPAADVAAEHYDNVRALWQQRPDLALLLLGVLLVGSVAAFLLARLIRRLVESKTS